jgi:hypothetical protein
MEINSNSLSVFEGEIYIFLADCSRILTSSKGASCGDKMKTSLSGKNGSEQEMENLVPQTETRDDNIVAFPTVDMRGK